MAEKYTIKRSRIAGKGVFASMPIAVGETVREFSGKSYDLVGMLRLVDSGKEEGSDPLGVDNDEYLDLDEISRTFNHSCEPNCFLRGRSELVALRDIIAGEELTYDYSTTMDDDEGRLAKLGYDKWTCPCDCGSQKCRGIIDQFHTLPKRVRQWYVRNGYAPDFILRKFSQR